MSLKAGSLLLALASTAEGQQFRLPFDGRWFVVQGGDTPNVNQHMAVRAQWYGLDFAKVGEPSQRALSRSVPTKAADFYSWGEPVLAPADGDITSLVDTLPTTSWV